MAKIVNSSRYILVVPVLLVCMVAQAFPFSDPLRLTSDDAYSGFPDMAIHNGAIHLAWQDERDGGMEIYYMRSDDLGSSWLSPTRVSFCTIEAKFPSIAVDSQGVIHIVWQDNREGALVRNFEIFYARSIDGGNSFSTERRLTFGNRPSMHPDLLCDDQDRLHLVWHDIQNGMYDVYYKRSLDGGLSWGDAIQLTSKPNYPLDPDTSLPQQPPSIYPRLASHGDKLAVVWFDDRFDREPLRRPYEDNWEIMYKTSQDAGETWGTSIRLTEIDNNSWFPDIEYDPEGKLHFVWQDDGIAGDDEIMYACPDRGIAPTRITNAPDYSYHPDIAIDSNGIHIVWMDCRCELGNWDIYYINCPDYMGNDWSEEVIAVSAPYIAAYPRLETYNDELFLAWFDNRDEDVEHQRQTNFEIYFARSGVDSLPPLVFRHDNKEKTMGIPQGRWYKGDLHCHTDHSDGGLHQLDPSLPRDTTVETQITTAEQRGLDFLSITDHRVAYQNFDWLYYSTQLLLLPGEEWGGGSHGTTWGIDYSIEHNHQDIPGTESAYWYIHAQGGLTNMSHPTDGDWYDPDPVYQARPIDCIEIWNGPYFENLPIGPAAQNVETKEFWEDALNMGYKWTAVGASDNHFHQLNPVAGVGQPCTWIYAEDLTWPALKRAFINGHVYVTYHYSGPMIEFLLDANGDGEYEYMMGDIADEVTSDPITFLVKVKGAEAGKIKVFSNQGQILTEHIRSNDYTWSFQVHPSHAWYRLEITRGTEGFNLQMLALTNPIYVEPSGEIPTPTPAPTDPHFTPTPTSTATRNPSPRILVAGYWDTRLSSVGGQLQAVALPESKILRRVEFLYEGQAIGITLKDDGLSGDGGANDGLYGIKIAIPFGSPSGAWLLELQATDINYNHGILWPYLTVQ